MEKTDRTRNVSRNILWGIINKVVTILLPFITRTIMIYTMGMHYVGLGSLFTSVLQVLSFTELGIGSALVFCMYRPVAEGDDEKVCALLNFYKHAYRLIGIIIMVVGLAITPFLDYLIAGDIPKGINLKVLFLVYIFNNVIGYFLFTYKQAVFQATQRVDVISRIGMTIQVTLSVCQALALLVLRNYYVYVLVIPIFTMVNNFALGILADKQFPQYKARGVIDSSEVRVIKKKVGGMVFQKIGNIILQSVDTLIISAFLGLAILGIYNGYFFVITALAGFFGVIQQALIPSIGNSVVVEPVEKNLSDFKIFHFLYMWIVIWSCSCLLCLFQPFMKMWQGAENMLTDKLVVLFVLYFFTYRMGDVNWIYREALGYWWEARFIPLISSLLNLILNIFLVNKIGLSGILISTIVSLTLVNLPWSSKVMFSKYFSSRKEYFLYLIRTLFYFVIMCIVAIVTYFACTLVKSNGLLELLIKGLICCILPNILLFLFNIKNKDMKRGFGFVVSRLPKKYVPPFVIRCFGD